MAGEPGASVEPCSRRRRFTAAFPRPPPTDTSVTDIAVATAVPQRRGLLRVLGVTFGLAVTIGNTIGGGILRTPGDIAAQLPSPTLYFAVWVAGAVYAMLGAVSIAELGTMLPRSGGLYTFTRYALGRYPGFLVGWSDWVSTCGSAAAVAALLAEYAGGLIPPLAGREVLVAAAVVIGFAVLQWRGIRQAGAAQTITTAAKALVLVALVVACFVLPVRYPPEAATPGVLPQGAALLTAIVLALQGVIYTYDGWTGVVYFSGEVRDPGRDIPRSMLGGVLLVTAIYLLLNLAFVHVVPLASLAGDPLAAGSAAHALFGDTADTIIRLVLTVALLSSVNALVLMGSRVAYAMSEGGLFPRQGATVNAGGTPTVALAATVAVAMAFIASGTFNTIIAVLAFLFVASYVLSFVAVFVLRRREPDKPRPYRAWGYPWTTGLGLLCSLAFLAGMVAGDTRTSLWALGVVASSYPLYLLTSALLGGDARRNAA